MDDLQDRSKSAFLSLTIRYPTILGLAQADAFLHRKIYDFLFYLLYLFCLITFYLPTLALLSTAIYVGMLIFVDKGSIIGFVAQNIDNSRNVFPALSVFTATLFFLSNVSGNLARLNNISAEDENTFRLSAYDFLLSTIFSVTLIITLYFTSNFVFQRIDGTYTLKFVEIALRAVIFVAALYLYFAVYRLNQLFWRRFYTKYGSAHEPRTIHSTGEYNNEKIAMTAFASIGIWAYTIYGIFSVIVPISSEKPAEGLLNLLVFLFYFSAGILYYNRRMLNWKYSFQIGAYFYLLSLYHLI